MSKVDLITADKIYRFTKKLTVEPGKIDWPLLCEYSKRLNGLLSLLGESGRDDYWRPVLRYFKNYRFALCSTPLPSDHESLFSETANAAIVRHVQHCNVLYPDKKPILDSVFNSHSSLVSSKENPLLETIIRSSDDPCSTAVLLKEPRFVFAVEQEFLNRGLNSFDVVTAGQARGKETFDRLLVIGPIRWFPDHILSSPRSANIRVLTFTFVNDSWSRRSPFTGTDKKLRRKDSGYEEKAYSSPATATARFDPDELVPNVDWSHIWKVGATRNQESDSTRASYDEDVQALLLSLEGDRAVFLEANDTSRALIIDPEHDEEEVNQNDSAALVSRIKTSAIEPGMFVLLRTYGSGDYIIPMADTILGPRASYARALQVRWKELLRNETRRVGFQNVCDRLSELGAKRANEINLRNWISPYLIRPRADEDFKAILGFVGLAANVSEYFENADRILAAHQSAGHRIRQMLVETVRSSDLSALERLGEMEFELPDADAGSLTAFRIISIAPNKYTILSSRIGVPFEIDSELNPKNSQFNLFDMATQV